MATSTEENLAEARTFIQLHGGDVLPIFPDPVERELERLVSLAILHGEARGLMRSAEFVAEAKTPSYPTACPTCRGTGGGVYNDCPSCDGNGVV